MDSADFSVGKVVNDKYRIISMLGEGGFGVVYKVELLLFDSGNTFALKRLHPSLSQDSKFRRRFLREAALAMQLIHENTIQIREFGRTPGGHLFFTMDYCEGEPLSEVIGREGFLSVNRALNITLQVLSVMQLAHSRGIIHRDLKPENVFLEQRSGQRDFVKVGDFGLAKSFGDDAGEADITRGGILGTPRYMSPEQAMGTEDLDHRSDLFSVGVMLFEMLYGEVPNDRTAEESRSGEPLREVVTPPTQPGHVIPGAVRHVVKKSLSASRANRFQSAEEFIDAIKALPVYTPSYLEPKGSRTAGKGRRWWKYVAGFMVVVLLGSLGLSLSDYRFSDWGRDRGQESLDANAPGDWPESATAADAATSDASLQPFEILGYLPFKKGAKFTYEIVGERFPKDCRITYEIVEADDADGKNPIEYKVKVSPGERIIDWVIDRERNVFYHRFLRMDSETGAHNQHLKEILSLPVDHWPLKEVYAFGNLSVLSRPMDLNGRFKNCLVVESREKNQLTRRFFKRGVGVVGILVYESQIADVESSPPAAGKEDHLVYARYLVPTPRKD